MTPQPNGNEDGVTIAIDFAMKHIAKQAAQIKELRKACVPFVGLMQEHNNDYPNDRPLFGINNCTITAGHVRKVIAALQRTESKES